MLDFADVKSLQDSNLSRAHDA